MQDMKYVSLQKLNQFLLVPNAIHLQH